MVGDTRCYLHSRKLIHRDLKPQNLLINGAWTCKIADFGVSTIKPQQTQTMTCIGTPVYMSPEVLAKNKYSEKADVYVASVVVVVVGIPSSSVLACLTDSEGMGMRQIFVRYRDLGDLHRSISLFRTSRHQSHAAAVQDLC